MIVTVFCSPNNATNAWRADLLEHTWRAGEQPGALVRLAPTPPGATLPNHRHARVEPTLPWNPHPYTQDSYPGTNLPGALLEWLHREPIDATLLVLDDFSVFRSLALHEPALHEPGLQDHTTRVVVEEVAPGQAFGTPWDLHPAGALAEGEETGPFGLDPGFEPLRQIAVNHRIVLPRVTFPVVIHSRDLRKIAARWLELTTFLRIRYQAVHGRLAVAHQLAYTIAAAEYRIPHAPRVLGVDCQDDDQQAPIATFRSAIESARGEVVWDPLVYPPWEAVEPERAKPGPGREVLALLTAKIAFDAAGGELAFVLPRRREGVREARLLDQMLLEIPGQEDSLSLNPSASAIWELCDDQRTLATIATELEGQYEMAAGSLRSDVTATAESLREAGALDLVDVAP